MRTFLSSTCRRVVSPLLALLLGLVAGGSFASGSAVASGSALAAGSEFASGSALPAGSAFASGPALPAGSAYAAAPSAAVREAQESPAPRLLTVDDLFELRRVSDPQISPDGTRVAYTVTALDREEDSSDTDVWMAPVDGGDPVRLTTSDRSESRPRWSPDGRWLAFLSGRDGDETQIWLLPTGGGEGRRLTDLPEGVSEYAWSPDSTRLAVVSKDPEEQEEDPGDGDEAEVDEDEGEEEEGEEGESEGDDEEGPEPMVITRLQFKRDGVGYLDERRDHVYVVDAESGEATQITDGPYDDSSPAWSSDGERIAFVSNRTEEPDANVNDDIFVVEAREGAEPLRLTTSPASDSSPAWSPDGELVVYTAGGAVDDVWYSTNDLALVPANGGERTLLTGGIDRNVYDPRFTPDGSSVLFQLEERLRMELASVPREGGDHRIVTGGARYISSWDQAPGGEIVVLAGDVHTPDEVWRVGDQTTSGGANAGSASDVAGTAAGASGGSAGGAAGELQGGAVPVGVMAGRELVRITRVNDEFIEGIELAPVEVHQAESTEGTTIDFFLVRPPDAPEGERLPTLLRIHGGPVSQFVHDFSFEWQLLAAHGYAVVGANPRGSSGRGRDFSHAIWADWGNRDFHDVMAAVDRAIELGVADPDRLGVGGWSYGGILTNYVITKTDRFDAAISGASEVNYTANYGHDHYQYVWEAELGLPWENTDLWIELSPFFHVDQVTTPTLVMCGQEDWNVPLQNSEQLYQALRRLGVDTELVVYPGESHGISRPSFRIDRYERYIDWYDRYVRDSRAP